MIVSVTFRHGTEKSKLRRWVNQRCFDFDKYTNNITRVQVVFSKESHKKHAADSVLCHISIHAAGRKHLDIYHYSANEGAAFAQAFSRASIELSRIYSSRAYQNCVSQVS